MNEQAQLYYQEIKEGNYWQDREDIIEFLYNYQLDKGAEFEIVNSVDLDSIVQDTVKYGWQRVACFLAGIDSMNEDYYRIDGYGNVKNITENDLECWLYDIVNGYYD